MPLFMNKNQVYLISTSEDVVLFCTKVVQKFATVHRFNEYNCVSKTAEGIMIFDAAREAETLAFLEEAHTFKCSLIFLVSPMLNEDIQRALRCFTSLCFSSILSPITKKSFMAFVERHFTDCHADNKICGRAQVVSQNETIEGLFAGVSEDIQYFRSRLRSVSLLDTPVFLLGETGCGKTTAARLIHSLSGRKNGPFVPVNVAEIVPSLTESTFFGKTDGAYTDAKSDSGFFKRAHHGVLFLDEIGTSKPAVQEKLLRFADEKEFTPVGSSCSVKLDARIILATNADIRLMLKKGTLRSDFFYRFDNNILTIPPLRDRPDDIPYIAKQYLSENKIKKFLSPTALEKLTEFSWPGNIRELHHCLERTALSCNTERIGPEDLDFGIFA